MIWTAGNSPLGVSIKIAEKLLLEHKLPINAY
jgi:hypothetical protein